MVPPIAAGSPGKSATYGTGFASISRGPQAPDGVSTVEIPPVDAARRCHLVLEAEFTMVPKPAATAAPLSRLVWGEHGLPEGSVTFHSQIPPQLCHGEIDREQACMALTPFGQMTSRIAEVRQALSFRYRRSMAMMPRRCLQPDVPGRLPVRPWQLWACSPLRKRAGPVKDDATSPHIA